MAELYIEDHLQESFSGEKQKILKSLFVFCEKRGCHFKDAQVTGKINSTGLLHIRINLFVTFLLNGHGSEKEFAPLTIWTDDSGSDCFRSVSLDENNKEIAWENVDICIGCGGCDSPGGKRKVLFGKEFQNVCITAMRFINPNAQTLECIKKLVEIRKEDIQKMSRD